MLSTRTPWYADLSLSTLGFSLLAGVLSSVFLLVFSLLLAMRLSSSPAVPYNPAPRMQLDAAIFVGTWLFWMRIVVLPIILSSAFCWWLCIVLPRRPRVLAGAGAGVLSVILALPLIWMLFFVSFLVSLPPEGLANGFSALPFIMVMAVILSLAFLFVTPFGWFILAIAAGAGALYALLVRELTRPYMLLYPYPYVIVYFYGTKAPPEMPR